MDLVGWYYLIKVKETLQVSEISSAIEKFKTKRISQYNANDHVYFSSRFY